ncbi:MAG: FAD-dependent oxidoreductase [Tabrizicola sp.]
MPIGRSSRRRGSTPPDMKVIVIGAGVIGLSAALMAQARGLSVTVVDREGPAAGASAGNAGAFAHRHPAFGVAGHLAEGTEVVARSPRPADHPAGLCAADHPMALPLLARLFSSRRCGFNGRSNCADGPFPGRARAVSGGNRNAGDAAQGWQPPGLRVRSRVPGLPPRLGGADRSWDRVSAPGRRADGQPATRPLPRFIKGTFTPGWWSIADPKDYVLALAEKFRVQGGTILRAEVTGLIPQDGGVCIQTKAEPLSADKVVVSAGAFAPHRRHAG